MRVLRLWKKRAATVAVSVIFKMMFHEDERVGSGEDFRLRCGIGAVRLHRSAAEISVPEESLPFCATGVEIFGKMNFDYENDLIYIQAGNLHEAVVIRTTQTLMRRGTHNPDGDPEPCIITLGWRDSSRVVSPDELLPAATEKRRGSPFYMQTGPGWVAFPQCLWPRKAVKLNEHHVKLLKLILFHNGEVNRFDHSWAYQWAFNTALCWQPSVAWTPRDENILHYRHPLNPSCFGAPTAGENCWTFAEKFVHTPQDFLETLKERGVREKKAEAQRSFTVNTSRSPEDRRLKSRWEKAQNHSIAQKITSIVVDVTKKNLSMRQVKLSSNA